MVLLDSWRGGLEVGLITRRHTTPRPLRALHRSEEVRYFSLPL